MKKIILLFSFFIFVCANSNAQSCGFDAQISTSDSVLCAGDSTTLSFSVITGTSVDTVVPTPIINNNGQDGNMFNIVATNTIRIRYFEGLIANTPNAVTNYYIYYKVGTHVGFENNSAAWTMIAGPVSFAPNAPNAMTIIPVNVNIVIPAGQTYAFYLTNTSAISNNNRYHNGTATGNTLSTNADLTIQEGTGGAYPFGTFFNARPWEGIVHYDYPPVSYLWNTGATASSITVQPTTSMNYSCVASVASAFCFVEDTINVQVNTLPVIGLVDTAICSGNTITFDAGNTGAAFLWCSTETTQTITKDVAGDYCVTVTDLNGCVNADTVHLDINTLPVVTTTGDTICIGDAGMVMASGATAYVWNPGSVSGASLSDSPTSNATYSVIGTDLNGCSDTTMASIYVNSLPTLALSGDTVCAGSTGTMMASGTASSFTWNPGSLSGGAVNDAPLLSTTYTVMATDANGCTTTDSTMISVNSLPAVSVSSFGTYCVYNSNVTLTGGMPLGGMYSGAGITGDTLSPSIAGNGTHSIIYTYTDSLGCSASDTADVIIDLCTGIIAQGTGAGINIYPNPFNESTTLSIDPSIALKDATFNLYDITGKLVRTMNAINSTSVIIPREQLQSGVYFYRLTNNRNTVASGKLMVD